MTSFFTEKFKHHKRRTLSCFVVNVKFTTARNVWRERYCSTTSCIQTIDCTPIVWTHLFPLNFHISQAFCDTDFLLSTWHKLLFKYQIFFHLLFTI